MIDTENNSSPKLTEEEMHVVQITITGISEMLHHIMSQHRAKDYAKSLCGAHKTSKKDTARTSILYNLIGDKLNLPAQPIDIREKLPDSIQDINDSDLTDILQTFIETFFLFNDRDKPRQPSKRPKGSSYEDDDYGGRWSSYERSEYLKQVMDTLKKAEVCRLIDRRLIEDGLLYEYLKYRTLVLFYLIRMDENALMNTIRPFSFVKDKTEENPKKTEIFTNKIKSINENELEREADKLAQSSLNMHREDNNLFVYIIAGVISLANIF
jgi:hypothetical protein